MKVPHRRVHQPLVVHLLFVMYSDGLWLAVPWQCRQGNKVGTGLTWLPWLLRSALWVGSLHSAADVRFQHRFQYPSATACSEEIGVIVKWGDCSCSPGPTYLAALGVPQSLFVLAGAPASLAPDVVVSMAESTSRGLAEPLKLVAGYSQGNS